MCIRDRYEIASLTLIYIIMIFVGLFIDKYLSLNYYLNGFGVDMSFFSIIGMVSAYITLKIIV